MRIGIDATSWANDRGYGRYTRELVRAMAAEGHRHELVCVLDGRAAAVFDLSAPNVEKLVVRQSESPTLAATTGSRRGVRDMLRLTAAVRRARCDAFLSPSVYGYFPLPAGLPAVVTVHDTIAERFPALTLPTWQDRWAWRAKVWLALRQARLVLTVSGYSAQEIARYLHVPPSRIRVTLEGVADAFRPASSEQDIRSAAARAGLPAGARWFLYVGGFGPHKHVDTIVRAHAEIARRHSDSPPFLALVGNFKDGFHSDVAGIQAVIRESGTEHLVKWLGYLPDEEVRWLHCGALALILVSASEGFGLPAVEAARCGTPVVATIESPLPGLLEGGGHFVRPGDVPELIEAMHKLATDESARAAMGKRALEQASKLSWRTAARVALETLEEVGAVAEKLESNAHART